MLHCIYDLNGIEWNEPAKIPKIALLTWVVEKSVEIPDFQKHVKPILLLKSSSFYYYSYNIQYNQKEKNNQRKREKNGNRRYKSRISIIKRESKWIWYEIMKKVYNA